MLHVLVGIFLGLTFQNSGQDADKVHHNLGFMLSSVVYLCYTSLMPGVLKCKNIYFLYINSYGITIIKF